jgi:hypothetical protein
MVGGRSPRGCFSAKLFYRSFRFLVEFLFFAEETVEQQAEKPTAPIGSTPRTPGAEL